MSTALSREVTGVSLATQSHYIIRRKFWSVLERVFRVFTSDGQLIMYIQHPLLKLREEFMVYADEARTRPLLLVKSRQIIAINFSYDVFGAETGYAEEQGMALLRRLFPILLSKHAIFVAGDEVAVIRQRFRLFTK